MNLLVYTLVLAVICCVSKGQPTKPAGGTLEVRSVRMKALKKSGLSGSSLPGPAEPVAGCTIYRLDSIERERVTNTFNHIRRQVAKGLEVRGTSGGQPMASNMERLSYDTHLEAFAHKFTEKCDPYFDQEISLEGFNNIDAAVLYHTSDDVLPPFNLSTGFEEHYNEEVVKFNGDDAVKPFTGLNSVSGVDVRPYAVFVNHDTRAIGCSQSTFFDYARKKYVRLAMCYYGNGYVKGKPLYRFGPPCDDAGRFVCDDGLIIRSPGYLGEIPEPDSNDNADGSTTVEPATDHTQESGDSATSVEPPVSEQTSETAVTIEPAGTEPSGADPSGTEPTGADPSGTDQPGADPSGTEPTGADPSGTDQPGADPSGTEPSGADPSGTDQPGVDPSGTEPSGADPSGTDQPGADPSGTEPSGTDTSGTEPSDLDPSDTDQPGADPSGTNPSDVDPSGSNPSDVNSSGSELPGANPSSTNPSDVDPSDSNSSDVDSSSTSSSDVDPSSSELPGADPSSTNPSDVDPSGSNSSDVESSSINSSDVDPSGMEQPGADPSGTSPSGVEPSGHCPSTCIDPAKLCPCVDIAKVCPCLNHAMICPAGTESSPVPPSVRPPIPEDPVEPDDYRPVLPMDPAGYLPSALRPAGMSVGYHLPSLFGFRRR